MCVRMCMHNKTPNFISLPTKSYKYTLEKINGMQRIRMCFVWLKNCAQPNHVQINLNKFVSPQFSYSAYLWMWSRAHVEMFSSRKIARFLRSAEIILMQLLRCCRCCFVFIFFVTQFRQRDLCIHHNCYIKMVWNDSSSGNDDDVDKTQFHSLNRPLNRNLKLVQMSANAIFVDCCLAFVIPMNRV